MAEPKEVTSKIKDILYFLASQQRNDGSFLDYAADNSEFKNKSERHTTFSAALILNCLCELTNSDEIGVVADRLIRFLITQKGDHWSFNYWIRDSKKAQSVPYPDDLDDTCVSLAGLSKCNNDIIDGGVLADVVKILTTLEAKEGGPYYTWLVPPSDKKAWKDIDLAVNSNVAYLLSIHGVSLPSISKLVEQRIEDRIVESPYYATEFPVIYFISRFYKGSKKDALMDLLLSKRNKQGYWDNPLNTALAVSALINLQFPIEELTNAIGYLIQYCNDRNWKAYPLIIEASIKGKKTYAGSPALTAAFIMESLSKWQGVIPKESNSSIQSKHGLPDAEVIKNEVFDRIYKRFLQLGDRLEQVGRRMINKVAGSDASNQKVLLPYRFAKAIDLELTSELQEIMIRLCQANLHGWLAYTIYDDFLDGEGGARLLSFANICLRELTMIYGNLLPESYGMIEIYNQLMDEVDKANHWEVTGCRARVEKNSLVLPKKLPDYEDPLILSQRSVGHALGPIAVLIYSGCKWESQEVQDTLLFIRHYITARQLSDDMHDWQEDIKAGHLTSVVTKIIKRYRESGYSISLDNDLPKLQEIFWYEVVDSLCQDIKSHCAQARECLARLNNIKQPQFLIELLTPLENMVEKTLTERHKAMDFLARY